MELAFTMLVPVLITAVALCGAARQVDVYDALVCGAGDGLGVLLKIIPPLIGLLTAVAMLRASGARLEARLSLRALLCAGAAGWSAALLPKAPGLRGILLPGTWYLAVLLLLWTLFRVVRWGDLLWLRGLARRHGKRT